MHVRSQGGARRPRRPASSRKPSTTASSIGLGTRRRLLSSPRSPTRRDSAAGSHPTLATQRRCSHVGEASPVATRTNKEVPDVDGQAQVRRGVGRGGPGLSALAPAAALAGGDCYPPPPPPEKAKCNAGNGNGSESTVTTVTHRWGSRQLVRRRQQGRRRDVVPRQRVEPGRQQRSLARERRRPAHGRAPVGQPRPRPQRCGVEQPTPRGASRSCSTPMTTSKQLSPALLARASRARPCHPAGTTWRACARATYRCESLHGTAPRHGRKAAEAADPA